jgi:hypothetical protein
MNFRLMIATAFLGWMAGNIPAAAQPAQKCTSQNIRGFPIEGFVCGGSTHALNCSPGAVYRCKKGAQFETNNCSLSQACATACITGPTSGTLNDSCFTGANPLTLSSSSVLGGSEVTFTATLADSHTNPAEINLRINRGDLVPGSYCGVPDIPPGVSSVSFNLPTAVVTAPSLVTVGADIAYTNAQGVSKQLVPVAQTLTLNPGGTEPPTPAIASFTLSPSTIASGGVSIMDVELAKVAPARGVPISVSSGNTAVASVIANGQPFIQGGCTTGGGAATIQAAKSVPQTTTVTIAASSGAAGQTAITNPLTVTAGCAPRTCFEVPQGTCGSIADGCGGTISCGCDFGQTCGGGGTPGVCGTAATLSVSGLSLNPISVAGGSSSLGTVSLNMAAPAGGAGAFLSSNNTAATVPQSVVVPQGQTTATFAAGTSAVQTTTTAAITAQLAGTVTAPLTITAGSTCTPTTCAAQGKNCGTISDGCGGTLLCGSCTSPQTCGGGGVANVCGGGISSTVSLTLTATGRSGESVSSSPAGLRVAVGTSGTASFATGTLVTLSVSNGRDAVWSGSCSSGGAKTKTCSLTMNAAASVTANVQ